MYSHVGGVGRVGCEFVPGMGGVCLAWVIARMQVARSVSDCSGVTGRRLVADVGESDTRRELMDAVWSVESCVRETG